jgi:hypothetical protein
MCIVVRYLFQLQFFPQDYMHNEKKTLLQIRGRSKFLCFVPGQLHGQKIDGCRTEISERREQTSQNHTPGPEHGNMAGLSSGGGGSG